MAAKTQLIYLDSRSFARLQDILGKRPGNYRVDPYYLRKGMGDKPYFWNDYARKWELVRLGDEFYFDEDGIPGKE